MSKKVDWGSRIGRRFGRLTVLGPVRVEGSRTIRVRCWCDCDHEHTVFWGNLVSRHTESCGCLSAIARAKHGRTKTKLHRAWVAMKWRCGFTPARGLKDPVRYRAYAEKGIKVCDEWLHDFTVFAAWAEGAGFQDHLELDRRDNDQGYSPDNCRWVTRLENVQNEGLLRCTNKSGYRGVFVDKGYKHHVVYKLKVNSRSGYKEMLKSGFYSKIAAARFRDAWCIVNEVPLPLNFPEMSGTEARDILSADNWRINDGITAR